MPDMSNKSSKNRPCRRVVAPTRMVVEPEDCDTTMTQSLEGNLEDNTSTEIIDLTKETPEKRTSGYARLDPLEMMGLTQEYDEAVAFKSKVQGAKYLK